MEGCHSALVDYCTCPHAYCLCDGLCSPNCRLWCSTLFQDAAPCRAELPSAAETYIAFSAHHVCSLTWFDFRSPINHPDCRSCSDRLSERLAVPPSCRVPNVGLWLTMIRTNFLPDLLLPALPMLLFDACVDATASASAWLLLVVAGSLSTHLMVATCTCCFTISGCCMHLCDASAHARCFADL